MAKPLATTAGATKDAWWERRWIQVGSHTVNSFWHCFGLSRDRVDLHTAIELLTLSRTALLPINTDRLRRRDVADNLLIGHGPVTWQLLREYHDVSDLVPCLNVNLQTTAEAAVHLALQASELTSITLLKLEVLGSDLRTSDDRAVVIAVNRLSELGEFVTMPLISANVGVARELVGLGVPLLRVMGGAIGSLSGIRDSAALSEIVSLGVPVIVDGGIGSPAHFVAGMRLGAAGGLINSLLFRHGDPVGAMAEFVAALEAAGTDDAEAESRVQA